MLGRVAASTPGDLIARGLAVFPVPPGVKVAPVGWSRAATTDPGVAAAWPSGGNVGVACRPSGVVALDLDRKDGVNGVRTFLDLCSNAGHRWPVTFTVQTPHGWHLYFQAPEGVVPSVIARWPGVDVRAPGRRIGGYLVGPGSVVDGRPYTVARDVPIARLPDWLTTELVGWRRRACRHQLPTA